MNIFGGATGLMKHVLDVRAVQHKVITSNIANEDTPGYRANELRFTDALAAARGSQAVTIHVSHSNHLSVPGAGLEGYIRKVPAEDLPLDDNSVNIDLEMAKLSDNAMSYKMAAELIARRFRGLLNVVREGR